MGRDHILAVLEGGRAVISWGPSNESEAQFSESNGPTSFIVAAQVWANRTWAPVSLGTYYRGLNNYLYHVGYEASQSLIIEVWHTDPQTVP